MNRIYLIFDKAACRLSKASWIYLEKCAVKYFYKLTSSAWGQSLSAKYLEYQILTLFIIAEIFSDRQSLAKMATVHVAESRSLLTHWYNARDTNRISRASAKKYVKMQKGNVTRGA
jgi:hypothetical protein